jgi:SAM-dependent MidA family methyltransferase
MGIASYLLADLERIARENHFKSFSATVLRENSAMLHVFKKRYPNAKTNVSGGSDVTLHMNFDDAVEPGEATGSKSEETDTCSCS